MCWWPATDTGRDRPEYRALGLSRYLRSGICGICRSGNYVDQCPEHWDEQDQDCPSELGTTVVVATAEIVDEAPNDEEDHREESEEDQQRPENAQEWEVVCQHVSFLSLID
jgi:hypothetical protein